MLYTSSFLSELQLEGFALKEHTTFVQYGIFRTVSHISTFRFFYPLTAGTALVRDRPARDQSAVPPAFLADKPPPVAIFSLPSYHSILPYVGGLALVLISNLLSVSIIDGFKWCFN